MSLSKTRQICLDDADGAAIRLDLSVVSVGSQHMSGTAGKALITGIYGQDGYYLAARLCALGYSVVGTSHRPDAPTSLRFGDRAVPVRQLDLASTEAVAAIVRDERPDEIYNLALDRVPALVNSARAGAELDWQPSLDFKQMIVQMVEAESV